MEAGIFSSLARTAIITVSVVALVVVISAFTAYPLARRANRLNKIIFAFILGVMMVPPLSILVSLYSVIVSIGGVNQIWAMVLILLTYQLPQGIFLYTNFIRAIPATLDEAAAIDGCGPVRTFFSIILPQLKPVTTSVVILSGINCWNDFQFSRYILQAADKSTATLAISSFFSQTYSDLNSAAAAALITILPVVIAFLFLQKYFIQGMIDSAIK
jgi:raffinose/stachyose/melibiose transport system permease protein